jgi:thiol-disulfide isomerase/thioredoxin
VLAAGVVLLAGCGGDAATTGAPAVTTSPATSPAPPPSAASTSRPATQAPSKPATTKPRTVELAGATVAGGSFDAADTLAGKPAVLWFWAPWCTVCRREAPDVAKVAKDLDGRVTFVGVAGRGPVKDMKRFVDDTGVGGFEHVVDDDGSRWTRFEVSYQPAYVFVDAQGRAKLVPSSMSEGELRDAATELTRR